MVSPWTFLQRPYTHHQVVPWQLPALLFPISWEAWHGQSNTTSCVKVSRQTTSRFLMYCHVIDYIHSYNILKYTNSHSTCTNHSSLLERLWTRHQAGKDEYYCLNSFIAIHTMSPFCQRWYFIMENASSIGLKSGEYRGRNLQCIPLSSISDWSVIRNTVEQTVTQSIQWYQDACECDSCP